MENGCVGCEHYLGGGCCALSLEMECADGGYEHREEHEANQTGDGPMG